MAHGSKARMGYFHVSFSNNFWYIYTEYLTFVKLYTYYLYRYIEIDKS